ncbi:(Fe-S)-binding protein [Kushneria phosphatilytica]|uniref:(Fe-S)-binding protein n=1 Tax=Kushneria phosphatilytica TaxID=657387 RepID=A0A1S1NVS4_9GAMM|nr:(Fe-S)-binding protein [Kushneria phosphatilytica]OHV10873.1 Fe-S oxidoreductase [Kushneria phosphatilytica]QEL12044.1 (Fe-S)-binding protein [Kushneria phosphatilytica]
MRVSLFVTCFNDTLFPETGRAVVSVLERLGHQIDFPMGQTCCGQMHHNSGYRDHAVALVHRFVEQFESAEAVVIPSTSCTAMVRHQYPQLARQAGDHALLHRLEQLLPRVHEFAEFLVRILGVTDVGAYYPHRVTYHASCNSLRALGIGEAPKRLLENVAGLEYVELPRIEECCGFGGTFSIKNAEVSTAMMSDKMAAILETGAEICTAGDNSCLMHIGGGLSRQQTGVRTVHLAEILASTAPGPLAAGRE